MEYDRHVAVLQGSILGFEKNPLNENDKCLRLSKVLDDLVNNNDKALCRKLFMCLLLNTNLEEIEHLRQCPDYAPLSDLFRISTESFIKLLTGKLWICFIEAIPTVIPISVLDQIVFLLLKNKEETHLRIGDVWTLSLVVPEILAIKLNVPENQEDKNYVENICNLLDEFFNASYDEKISLKLKLFGILILLRLVCSNNQGLLAKFIPSSIVFMKDLAIPLPSTSNNEFPSEILKKLLASYLEIAKEVTVDMWIDLSEAKTDTVASKLPFISIWEVGTQVPSNLQMLLAHYSYEVKEYLSRNECSNVNAIKILESFATKYNRISELKLESLVCSEILAQLDNLNQSQMNNRNSTDNDWKRAAYSEYLLSHMWDEVMGKTSSNEFDVIKCIQTLTINARFLKKFCSRFYEEVASHKLNDSARKGKLKLFLTTFKCLEIGEVENVLAKRLAEHGVHSAIFLDTDNFYHDLRNFLNRIVFKKQSVTTELQRIELYHFILQSPKEVMFYLIQEAIENKGKIDVVSEVFSLIPDHVMEYSIDTSSGECMLITSALVLKFIVIIECIAKEPKENYYALLKKIFSKNEHLAKNIALHFVKNVNEKTVDSVSNILYLAFQVTKISAYDTAETLLTVSALCQMASYLYHNSTWGEASLTTNLPILLEILNKFCSEISSENNLIDNIVEQFLHEELKGYILDKPVCTASIRNMLRSMYFDQADKEYVPQKELVLELAICLPKLLPNEWSVLNSNLKVGKKRISEVNLLEACQLIISTVELEDISVQYVMQSVGNIISLRLQEDNIPPENDIETKLASLLEVHAKLCQVIVSAQTRCRGNNSFHSLEMTIINVLSVLDRYLSTYHKKEETDPDAYNYIKKDKKLPLDEVFPHILSLSKCDAKDIALYKLQNSTSLK